MSHKGRSRIDAVELDNLRALSIIETINLLGLYAKQDQDYKAQMSAQSKRINVSVGATVIELIVTGSKWYDTRAQKGGGGAIDLTMHLCKEPFLKAVQRLKEQQMALHNVE